LLQAALRRFTWTRPVEMTVTVVFFFPLLLLLRERLLCELIERTLPPRLLRPERDAVMERRERDFDPPTRVAALRRRLEVDRELLEAVRRRDLELAERERVRFEVDAERLRLDAERERLPLDEDADLLREEERDLPLLFEPERKPAVRALVRDPPRLDAVREVPRCEPVPARAIV
jgi:hypothetical protein